MAKDRSGKPGLDTRLAKSVGHPIRIEVMRILNERTASPSQLARALGQGIGHVSYHVQELNRYGCVELVRTEPRRGALEHFYRATRPGDSRRWLVDDEEARALSRAERGELTATALQAVFGEALGALRAESFQSRPDSHTSWIGMDLDDDGWTEMTALLVETLNRAKDIWERSTERLEVSGEEGFPALVSLIAFERSGEPLMPGEDGDPAE